jgi:hypothetical protein
MVRFWPLLLILFHNKDVKEISIMATTPHSGLLYNQKTADISALSAKMQKSISIENIKETALPLISSTFLTISQHFWGLKKL